MGEEGGKLGPRWLALSLGRGPAVASVSSHVSTLIPSGPTRFHVAVTGWGTEGSFRPAAAVCPPLFPEPRALCARGCWFSGLIDSA